MEVNDFDDALFDNPIELLNAIQNKKNSETESLSKANNIELENADYLTAKDIIQTYGIEKETLVLAINNSELTPIAYVPVFSKEEVSLFIKKEDEKYSAIERKFLYELAHMKVNYSYKAVLLLSIFSLSEDDGTVEMSCIIDFFIDYFRKRKESGLVVENPESTFVKYFGNKEKARKTILRYPVKIYTEKDFLRYDSKTDSVILNELLKRLLIKPKKDEIISKCNEILFNYYQLLS